MLIRPIQPGEEKAAARLLLFVSLGREPADVEVTEWMGNASASGIDLSRQVVAADANGAIAGVALYAALADGTANASPPVCDGNAVSDEMQADLVRGLRRKAADDGMKVLQVFCDEHDAHARAILAQGGLEELALMRFMERPVTEADRKSVLDKDIRWVTYDASRRDAFECVVAETYRGTLDCAKLGEVRDVGGLLDGYASGGFDPSLWFLARLDGRFAACLLLTPDEDKRRFEVSYVGVVPSCRGKGLGRKVMRKGLKEVALRSHEAIVTLAVDDANTPALDMYFDLGFTVVASRRVCFSLLATA